MYKFAESILGVTPIDKQDVRDLIDETTERLQKQQDLQEAEEIQQKMQDPHEGASRCIFLLYPDGHADISMKCVKGTSPKLFGKMLYLINNGDFATGLYKTLEAIVEQNPGMQGYVDEIMNGWEKEIADKDVIIKPNEVFKINHGSQE